MRLEARVLEGDQTVKALVPLATIIEFHKVHGYPLNDCIPIVNAGQVLREGRDFVEWEPWVCHHAVTQRSGESRTFDEWSAAVDWCGVYEAADELDPSGGEESRTPASSPESSSAAPRGRTSSRSTSGSKPRSGGKSAG